MLALSVLGAADSVSVFVRQSLVQILTPDAMRGRVSAVSSLFISASNELGEFESGVAARILGPIGAAIFGGVGSVVLTGAVGAHVPEPAQGALERTRKRRGGARILAGAARRPQTR